VPTRLWIPASLQTSLRALSHSQVSRRFHLQAAEGHAAGRLVVPCALPSLCPIGTVGLLRKMGRLPGWSVAPNEQIARVHGIAVRNVHKVYERHKAEFLDGEDCFRLDFPIGGFSPPEGRLARGCKPPAFSRFLFQSAVKSAESF